MTSGHESIFCDDSAGLVCELHRTVSVGISRRHSGLHGFRMTDDGPKISYHYADMEALLHVEIYKVFLLEGDRGMDRLLQDFYILSESSSLNTYTGHGYLARAVSFLYSS